ncbi:hypothetical protein B0H66DRAFT_616427 [Apodospora peruviana]|uniref:Uncharacterized protein n=1 Tax=Apodospora peruviana TaxID=516989 RepID=A0AAE0MC81_9PEZI|nr:hypothetical protein B0H66DRAFT_616427 [Apodospora peruviana]
MRFDATAAHLQPPQDKRRECPRTTKSGQGKPAHRSEYVATASPLRCRKACETVVPAHFVFGAATPQWILEASSNGHEFLASKRSVAGRDEAQCFDVLIKGGQAHTVWSNGRSPLRLAKHWNIRPPLPFFNPSPHFRFGRHSSAQEQAGNGNPSERVFGRALPFYTIAHAQAISYPPWTLYSEDENNRRIGASIPGRFQISRSLSLSISGISALDGTGWREPRGGFATRLTAEFNG